MLVFTSCITNYLPKARVLAASLKEHHKDWTFCLLLGDNAPPNFDLDTEPFDRLLTLADLDIPDLRAWMFQHRLVEFCTAIKGFALNHFLEKEHCPKVMYLDPDIMVCNSLATLERLLDAHDILLTPHQLAPQHSSQAIWDNEICSLQHGVFNLGFVACAARTQGIAFSRFWRDRLAAWCRDDKAQGLFTDQKWCDLVPAYFSAAAIVRDPGYNAASWNLTDRHIRRDSSGTFYANDVPLRFYHFTGHDSGIGKTMSSIYGSQMPAVAELWDIYEQKLNQSGHKTLKATPWSGGFYSNGQAIEDQARHYYRDTPAIQSLYPDPFATNEAGTDGFAGHWQTQQRHERNKLYVLARKPFRLAYLASVYLQRHGGIKAVPMLASRVRDVWQEGGWPGLLAKIRKFKTRMAFGQQEITLARLLSPQDEAMRQWFVLVKQYFQENKAVLILDHMYGGGANDYRNQRIRQYLDADKACLLLTWDFFGEKLISKIMLPGGRSLQLTATDLSDFLNQELFQFSYILLNEFVLWSDAAHAQQNHYAAISHLLDTVCAIKRKNSAFLEIAVHDFYAVCPSYNLLENQTAYCEVPKNLSRCKACLKQSPFNVPAEFDLTAWRKAWQQGFACADEVRIFSRSTLEILQKCFHFAKEQVIHKPHEPLEQFAPIALNPAAPLHIGVIGHIAHHKGAKIVRELASLLHPEEKLTVVGSLDGPHPENINIYGEYVHGDLCRILKNLDINLCLVPSICPETFCYTVQEVMQLNLPLVVFPLGAQAERTAAYAKGLVAADVSAAAALTAIRDLYSRKRNEPDPSV